MDQPPQKRFKKTEDELEELDTCNELVYREPVLAGLGTWSTERRPEQSYPAQIDIEPESAHRNTGQSTPGTSSSRSPSRIPTPGASTPTPTRTHIPRLSAGALKPTDVEELLRFQNESKKRGRRGSSENDTISSSYGTAPECPTPHTQRSSNGESDGGRPLTPYPTPSHHTPSHRSLGTTEGTVDIRPPRSPFPFSAVHTHNDEYAQLAIEKANNIFPDRQDSNALE